MASGSAVGMMAGGTVATLPHPSHSNYWMTLALLAAVNIQVGDTLGQGEPFDQMLAAPTP